MPGLLQTRNPDLKIILPIASPIDVTACELVGDVPPCGVTNPVTAWFNLNSLDPNAPFEDDREGTELVGIPL